MNEKKKKRSWIQAAETLLLCRVVWVSFRDRVRGAREILSKNADLLQKESVEVFPISD